MDESYIYNQYVLIPKYRKAVLEYDYLVFYLMDKKHEQ